MAATRTRTRTRTRTPQAAVLAVLAMLVPGGDADCIGSGNSCHGQNDECEEGYFCQVNSGASTGDCRVLRTHGFQYCQQGVCPFGMDCVGRSPYRA